MLLLLLSLILVLLLLLQQLLLLLPLLLLALFYIITSTGIRSNNSNCIAIATLLSISFLLALNTAYLCCSRGTGVLRVQLARGPGLLRRVPGQLHGPPERLHQDLRGEGQPDALLPQDEDGQ